MCLQEYRLNAGKCEKREGTICPVGSPKDASGACIKCSDKLPNCMSCWGTDKCDVCERGFKVGPTGQCVSGCQLGSVEVSSAVANVVQCLPCPPNALECKQVTVTGTTALQLVAIRCRPSFALKGGNCIPCDLDNGSFYLDGKCAACHETCMTCSRHYNCITCKAGLVKQPDGTCA